MVMATAVKHQRGVVVTIFTSIPNIAETLQRAAIASSPLNLQVLQDEALGGYGGTVEFDPQRLQAKTVKALKTAQILIAEPAVIAKLLQHDPSCLANLEWCQSTYAGVDPLFIMDNNTTPSGLLLPQRSLPFRLTRFAGKFGPPIAEWCLARIISHERKFALSAADQLQQRWAGSRQVTTYRYLRDLTLTILGATGDIGLCIAKSAKALGMRVVGFAKRKRDELPSRSLDLYTTDLSKALQEADYIVSILPSTPDTRGLLGGYALAPAGWIAGGKSPVLLNVGRGDVIDEQSLVHALDNNYISTAILDVFEQEPLPEESVLWGRTDVVVSPHVSGVTRAEDVPDVFLENYQRFIDGKELLYQVDWSRGY